MLTRTKKAWIAVFLAFLCLKCAVMGYYFFSPEIHGHSVFVTPAIAEEKPSQPAEPEPSTAPMGPVDEFLESIKQRRLAQIQEREELAKRQAYLAQDEQSRLEKAKRDLRKVLEEMASLETRFEQKLVEMDAKIKQQEDLGGEKLARLAKVYEETPPEQAGPMLTKLDPHMAAQILMRMNPRKAGKIWGQVKPEEGVRISEEMVELKK